MLGIIPKSPHPVWEITVQGREAFAQRQAPQACGGRGTALSTLPGSLRVLLSPSSWFLSKFQLSSYSV